MRDDGLDRGVVLRLVVLYHPSNGVGEAVAQVTASVSEANA
jgi:hypothetical protein